MEFKYKLIMVAILAILSGTAFAAPMLIVPLDIKPYPLVDDGPKANFAINILYANFTVSNWERSYTDRVPTFDDTGNWTYVNVTKSVPSVNVTYMVVANITNLSEINAKMYDASFIASQEIKIIDSALGGISLGKGYSPSSNFDGIAEGVWLDGKWLNATWIPGKDYPTNVYRALSQERNVINTIPSLPENASEKGTWIEGVLITEYCRDLKIVGTHIYINGVWVDVTGRIKPWNPQPMVLADNTLVNLVLTSSTPPYKITDNSTSPIPILWRVYRGQGLSLRWAGLDGFSSVWAPHESKLIMFNGTQMFSSSETINSSVASMESGTIDLYGSITSLITNLPINGTFYNTMSTANWLNSLPLQKTLNSYVYNATFTGDQAFGVLPNGVEVYVKEDSYND